ncbi:glycosyltransferase [Kaistella yonginensis]|uniref:glycosyltransferase n=1 Tax=Kaistella yonginensis TaxID=658267 RepID=UPI0025B50F77|nr:glycosyltransferase [Kaistella yonginensis]MDN3605674.1 glycosyltransferase [Kaistella yonginensis]
MKISVALCTYNGGKFLGEQLSSIFSQTLPVDEVIICDDCSTDNTVEIIQKYIFLKYTQIIERIYQTKNHYLKRTECMNIKYIFP